MMWPELFMRKKAQETIEYTIPALVERIEFLESEVKRLEAEKAGRRGRKNSDTRVSA